MSTLNMLIWKKTRITLLKIQAKPKKKRKIKQTNKQTNKQKITITTTTKKEIRTENKRGKKKCKVITDRAVVDFFEHKIEKSEHLLLTMSQ